MDKKLSFDSLDELKDYLKVLYQTSGIQTVRDWVIDNFLKGTILSFKNGLSGDRDESVCLCDRRMELLDRNGIEIVNTTFLSPLSEVPEHPDCTVYFSLRVLFIEEPFGLVVYRKIA